MNMQQRARIIKLGSENTLDNNSQDIGADIGVPTTGKIDVSAIAEKVQMALEQHRVVAVHFGDRVPNYEVLVVIAPYWKKRRVQITAYHNSDFKSAIRTLKKLTAVDR